jgi:phosphoenolpyruvate carboxylase
MFNSRRIEELESEISKLKVAIADLQSEVIAAKEYRFYTGETEMVGGHMFSYDMPEVKSIPVKDILAELLTHAGIEPKYQKSTDGKATLQTISQTEPKQKRSRKQMNKTKP